MYIYKCVNVHTCKYKYIGICIYVHMCTAVATHFQSKIEVKFHNSQLCSHQIYHMWLQTDIEEILPVAAHFQSQIDAAGVYWNCSSRFAWGVCASSCNTLQYIASTLKHTARRVCATHCNTLQRTATKMCFSATRINNSTYITAT